MKHTLHSHARTGLALGLGVALAVCTLVLMRQLSFPGASLVRNSYNLSHFLGDTWQPELSDSPVALVYLDQASHQSEQQNPLLPWDRRLHARLVQRLTAAGAKAIVFDILFSDPGNDREATEAFAKAIKDSGRVVLASELSYSSLRMEDSAGARVQNLTLPTQDLLQSAKTTGLANLIVEDDFIVRRCFPGFDPETRPALAWAALGVLNSNRNTHASQSPASWLRYYGRALTLPHVSYTHALDPQAVPDSFFRDRIVYIGAKPITGAFTERRDEFRSPYPSWRRDLFMPAVEIHATQTLNLIRGDGLHRLPASLETGLLILVPILFSLLLFWQRPWVGLVTVLGTELAVLAGVVWGFAQMNLWFPWLLVSALQIPGCWIVSIVFHSLEWQRARRRLEHQRRLSEKRILEQAALIDKARDAILVMSLEGLVRYANPGASLLYGWSSAEFEKPGVADQLFAPCADQAKEAQKTTLRTGAWAGEMQQATRSGDCRIVRSRWTLLNNDQGSPDALLLMNTDVTHERQLEAQFLRTQRLQAVWSLAGGMAHDLSNALAPVLMGVQRLQKQITDPESQRTLSIIESNTRRGADMVRQVLTFSRGKEGDRQVLPVERSLRDMERIAAQTFPKSISVVAMTPPDLWPVLGNATQLHQVLVNLCINARDAMPQGGQLTLAADNVRLSAEEAASMPKATPGDYVMILVSDTGTGIPPEVMPHLFEPFFTTKPEGRGTGLGLHTTAQIVSNHGGFIHVRTEPGQGATFEIYFPRAEHSSGEVHAPQGALVEPGGGRRILIADDEESVREMLTSILQDQGYQVTAVRHGGEVITHLEQEPKAPDLVLLDSEMPVMNGQQTLEILRARWPQVRSLRMGTQPSDNAPSPSPALDLLKPFTTEQLLLAVQKQLSLG